MHSNVLYCHLLKYSFFFLIPSSSSIQRLSIYHQLHQIFLSSFTVLLPPEIHGLYFKGMCNSSHLVLKSQQMYMWLLIELIIKDCLCVRVCIEYYITNNSEGFTGSG